MGLKRKIALCVAASLLLLGADCGMVRTADRVRRFTEKYTGPFLGLSEHKDAAMVGATHCSDCNNVLLIDGRIQQRFSLTMLGSEIGDEQPRSMEVFRQRVSTPAADPVTYEDVVLALTEDVNTSAFTWYRWTGSAWNIVTNLGAEAGSGRFVTLGLEGRGNTSQSVPAYNRMAYLLNGGDSTTYRMRKAPGNGGYDAPIGIAALTGGTVASAGSTCSNFPSNCRFAVSLCDRLQAPVGSSFQHPGQESNSVAIGAIQDMNLKNVRFTAPTAVGWTHARLYVNFTGDPTYKLIGNFPRHADFKEDTDYETLTLISGITYDLYHDYTAVGQGGDPDGSQVVTADAYDFRPVRNHPPEQFAGFTHFAMFNGRGFWANRNEPLVYYADPWNIRSGGHPEQLSGEYLVGFQGPITLLAEYNNSLVISDSHGLHRLTGQISSHTNATTETGATIGETPPRLVPVAGTTGAISEGYGDHIEIDDLLFYISNRGLEAFDGSRSFDLSRAIRNHAEFDNSSWTDASFAYEPRNGFLLITARPNVWVYHTRLIDPVTGVGSWTFWDKADRSHDFYVCASSHDVTPSVYFGSYQTSSDRGRFDSFPSELESSSEVRPWTWISGDIDLGAPDRRKRFYTITVHGWDDTADFLRVGYSVDGATFIEETVDLTSDRTVKIHVGEYGRRLQVRFRGLTAETTGNAKVFGFDVDAELLDWF